jgi:hypothetical protein
MASAISLGRMIEDDEAIRLGSMRRHGVRSLFVSCQVCAHVAPSGHSSILTVRSVASFGPRMHCSCSGKLGATALPKWIEPVDRYAAALLPALACCVSERGGPFVSGPKQRFIEQWGKEVRRIRHSIGCTLVDQMMNSCITCLCCGKRQVPEKGVIALTRANII